MNPKHVLILPSSLYRTEYSALGGIFQYHLAECLKNAGYQVGVISAGLLPFKSVFMKNPYANPVFRDEDGVAVARIYKKAWAPQRYLSPALQVRAARELGGQAFEQYRKNYGKPDVIHAHDCLYAGVLAQEIKSKHNIPFVITEHSSAHFRNIYTQTQSDIIRNVLGSADAITTVSTAVMTVLKTKYKDRMPPQRCSVIYNLLEGFFEERELSPALPHALSNDGFTFLHVANLVDLKKQTNLIRAMKQVIQVYPNIHLKIGGSGPMRKPLEDLIAGMNLSGHVELLGYLSRDRVMREMSLCNAFVLASEFETFGVVLIEAMSMGKPVISTRCGGPEDIVDDLCGILVKKDNIDDLAKAMIKLIQEYDSFQPMQIREHCIQRFGKDAFLQRLDDIYQPLIKTNRGEPANA